VAAVLRTVRSPEFSDARIALTRALVAWLDAQSR